MHMDSQQLSRLELVSLTRKEGARRRRRQHGRRRHLVPHCAIAAGRQRCFYIRAETSLLTIPDCISTEQEGRVLRVPGSPPASASARFTMRSSSTALPRCLLSLVVHSPSRRRRHHANTRSLRRTDGSNATERLPVATRPDITSAPPRRGVMPRRVAVGRL